MKHSHTTNNESQINPVNGYRAITFALFSLILLLAAHGTTAATGNGDLPEFPLPSREVDAYKIDLNLPVPIKVEAPKVHKGLIGTKVTMSFSILKSGKVTVTGHNAGYYDNEAYELALIMNRKLRTWRFEPARDKDGNAVSVKVKMPVEVVPFKKTSDDQLANLSLSRPVIVAIAKR